MRHSTIANILTNAFWLLLLVVSAFAFWVVPQTQIQRAKYRPAIFSVAGAATSIPHAKGIMFDSLQPSQNFSLFEDEKLVSQSAIVVDAKTGDILYAKDADRQMPLASLSKIITATFLFSRGFESDATGTIWPNGALASYGYGADDTEAAALKKNSATVYSAKDLLLASLLPSANNATFALVESQGIRPADFSEAVREYLTSQGFWKTHVEEPSGLSSDNVSTAREFASVMLEGVSQREIYDALLLREAELIAVNTKEKTLVRSTNALLGSTNVRVLAGKTGYLPEAGYNFAALAEHTNGRLLVCVLLNAPTPTQRFQDAEALLQWVNEAFE